MLLPFCNKIATKPKRRKLLQTKILLLFQSNKKEKSAFFFFVFYFQLSNRIKNTFKSQANLKHKKKNDDLTSFSIDFFCFLFLSHKILVFAIKPKSQSNHSRTRYFQHKQHKQQHRQRTKTKVYYLNRDNKFFFLIKQNVLLGIWLNCQAINFEMHCFSRKPE